jgi:hypothetical protein
MGGPAAVVRAGPPPQGPRRLEIGWDPLTRAQRLKLIVNQARFLSHGLDLLAKRSFP